MTTPERRHSSRWRRGTELNAVAPTFEEQANTAFKTLLSRERRWVEQQTKGTVKEIEVDEEEASTVHVLLNYGCVDRTGIIRVVQRVVSDVKRIGIYDENGLDVVHRRSEAGVWRSTLVSRASKA